MKSKRSLIIMFFPVIAIILVAAISATNKSGPLNEKLTDDFKRLELAIRDLKKQFPGRYDVNNQYLERLENLRERKETLSDQKSDEELKVNFLNDFNAFRNKALLANPLLGEIDTLLIVMRKAGRKAGMNMVSSGLASNHENHTSLPKTGWDNEIVTLSPVQPDGELKTLFRPPGTGYIGEMDLHWNADRILFTVSDQERWKLCEIDTDGNCLQQVLQLPSDSDIDCFDGCYLPDGNVIFNSNATIQSVPCWHGARYSCNLYIASSGGTDIRQVCFDQDHDWHPSVMNNGQVLFTRWDYTGTEHPFLHHLFVMNPDGTGQRSLYGTNTYWPNSMFYAKSIPGSNHQILAVITGYHDYPKSGYLVVVDLTKGYKGLDGITTRISGKGEPLKEVHADIAIQGNWPVFTTPFPLSDKYFLVSKLDSIQDEWVICLADIFDNVIELRREEGYDLLEPIPLVKQKKPPVVAERINLDQKEGTVYLQDVYLGPGLEGIPRGTVKKLRIFSWNYGFYGLAGPNKIGYGGPWDASYLLGTTPVQDDGSAMFRVPANMPVAIQPLDEQGRAMQLMRSWFTVMPGEVRSCVGCHEDPRMAPPVRNTIASRMPPQPINSWYGPMRGFDFEREVQPVLNHYCVECHNGSNTSIPDLRGEKYFPDYEGRELSRLAKIRIHEDLKEEFNGKMKYTPAYEELLPYIRRDGIEAEVEILTPGPVYTATSELVQLLKKGHHGVQLNREAWERIYTWIDLNGPCHGTWGDIHQVPDRAYERRRKNAEAFTNQEIDPEVVPETAHVVFPENDRWPVPEKIKPTLENWPLTPEQARTRQQRSGETRKNILLEEGIALELVRIPGGTFVMGDNEGKVDERPVSIVKVKESFWMSRYEVTNKLYRLFKPDHDSKYYSHRREKENDEDKGASLNGPDQPVVNISWEEAMAFCRWLSLKTGIDFTLPTEAQWEYACRAGSGTALHYGEVEDDFTSYANVGDFYFSQGKHIYHGDSTAQVTGMVPHMWLDGAALADKRFNDHGWVTVAVGSYQPNHWGLFDMHGNAAEWTLSTYCSYPYQEDERNTHHHSGIEKVVRGGSFYDRPARCRSAYRLSYPGWMKVFNVGFRVVCITQDKASLSPDSE